ncbi:MAG: BrnT family toxin [Nitrospira sp.]|nr:BrnT family toxin [Nitrospira sp.]
MDDICFVWDDNKAATNQRKHGVSFEEAKSAFADEYARLITDPDHSMDEERFVLLGLSSELRVLVVCHCYRQNDHEIRIISARKASRHEQKQYRELQK